MTQNTSLCTLQTCWVGSRAWAGPRSFVLQVHLPSACNCQAVTQDGDLVDTPTLTLETCSSLSCSILTQHVETQAECPPGHKGGLRGVCVHQAAAQGGACMDSLS